MEDPPIILSTTISTMLHCTMHVMSFVIEPRDAVGRQYKTTEPKRSQGHRVSSLNVDFIGLKISRDGDFIGSVPQGEKK